VRNKDRKGYIVCDTETASVMMNPHPSVDSIRIGQMISVRVTDAAYIQGSHKISVSAIPFLQSHTAIVYRILPCPDDQKAAFDATIKPILEILRAEIAASDELSTSAPVAWNFMKDTLYSYTEHVSGPIEHDILSILTTTSGFVSRDPAIDLSTGKIYKYESTAPKGDRYIIKYHIPALNVVISILEDYIGFLRTMREMIEIYNSKELLDSHKNLWMIFRKNKRPPPQLNF
jgi:hypothetical protein